MREPLLSQEYLYEGRAPGLPDITREGIELRIAQWCHWFKAEPPELDFDGDVAQLTVAIFDWVNDQDASFDWIYFRDAKTMATAFRRWSAADKTTRNLI